MDDDLDMRDDEQAPGIIRWLPRLVVFATLVGFFSLAWYAYRTGTQSVKEEELLIVEADKTPMKEQPADPGGMKFPNQDKTIFETFGGNQAPPKVERVLPAPEEPMPSPSPSPVTAADTKGWVNERLQKKEAEVVVPAAKPEQVIGAAVKADANIVKPSPVEPSKQQDSAMPGIVSYTMDKKEQKTAAPAVSLKPEPAPEEPKEFAPPPKEEPKPVKADVGKIKVQLGAYRSEKEAKEAWAKMQKKHQPLAQRAPIIVKADLGAKGVYYRLRAGGFASAAEAKAFCASLAGQACIVAP